MNDQSSHVNGTLPPVTFAIQNVNSLSISDIISKKQGFLKKCHLAAKQGEDFIFLCDIRITNTENAKNLLQKTFLELKTPYNILFNSKGNKRGVAILIRADLGAGVEGVFNDEDGNIILAKVKINNRLLILGSIYGPNRDFAVDFYAKLSHGLELLNGRALPICLGGDWNCVYDLAPANRNQDILNMNSLPNPNNGKSLSTLCDKFDIGDPFRILNPYAKEYSYIPFGTVRTNRSRLDFFLVSNSLINKGNTIEYNPSKSSIFDHKRVTFKTKKGEGGKKGRGGTLNHGSLLEHDNPKIILAAVSAFIQCSASPEVERWNENLNSINALILELANLEQVLDNWDCDIPDPRFRELLDFKSNYERLIKTKIRSTLPNLANSNLEISSDPCTFLWVLINQLKNVNIQHQIKVKKREEEVSRSLLDQLHKLKKNM